MLCVLLLSACTRLSPPKTPTPEAAGQKHDSDMVCIPGGTLYMGSDEPEAREDEGPVHRVEMDSFWIDAKEVTNREFADFVKATGYLTTAEQTLEDGLPAGSLVWDMPGHIWRLDRGANWQHPQGAGSDLRGREDHPVVHISWYDASAYARWCGKRLPTEAEWEYAARYGRNGYHYPWGMKFEDGRANTWQGNFPDTNKMEDGFLYTAPVGHYGAYGFGLYDMAGNVWEWCADRYHAVYYASGDRKCCGPETTYDPDEPGVEKRVMRGGSFLCSDNYCTGYRTTARMKAPPGDSYMHTGFRCVRSMR